MSTIYCITEQTGVCYEHGEEFTTTYLVSTSGLLDDATLEAVVDFVFKALFPDELISRDEFLAGVRESGIVTGTLGLGVYEIAYDVFPETPFG